MPISLGKPKKGKNKRDPEILTDKQKAQVPDKVVEIKRHDKPKRSAKPVDRDQNKFGRVEDKNEEIYNIHTSANNPTSVNPNYLFFFTEETTGPL